MALDFIDGFETRDYNLWPTATGTVQVTIENQRTGYYAFDSYPTNGVGYIADSSATPQRQTVGVNVWSMPDQDTVIIGDSSKPHVVLKSTGYLQLIDGINGSVDVGSTNLSLYTWYRVCLSIDGSSNAAKIYVNGNEECSGTVTSAENSLRKIGVSTANTTADIFFDDYAEDSTESTDDIGDIHIAGGVPVSEGTDDDNYSTYGSAGWANSSESADAVYTEIDAYPPSTSSYDISYGGSGTYRYSVEMSDCGSGLLSEIGGSDTIEAVNFLWYYKTDAGGADDYGIRIRCSDDGGSPYTDDNIDDPKDPTWLSEYHVDTPVGANAWTQSYVNSLEMGMATVSSGGKELWWYDALMQVAFKVVSAGAINVNVNEGTTTVSDAIDVYITPYLINQSDENPEVTDGSIQYLNPYPLISVAEENPSVEDYAEISIISANLNISAEEENPSITDETAQYITPYPLISVYDDLELQDETSQYLSLFEINVYDDLAIEDITSQFLSLYEVNQYDSLEVQEDATVKSDVQISVYDDISIEDISEQYLSLYEIYVSDDLDIQDAIEQYLSLYEINVYDSLDINDSTSQYLTIYEIYVIDDLSLQDAISLFLTIYEIYAYDDLAIEDYEETAVTGEGILSVNEYDSLTLTDESLQYLNKYIVSAFDDLNIEDTSSQYLTIYEINVSDNVSVQEDSIVETVGAGIISIEQYDELSLIDSSAQYLSLYEIYAYDGLTSEDFVSLYLSSYIISVYDSLTVQESAALELRYYEISVSENLTVQDESDVLTTSADILYVYEYDGLNIQDSQDTQLTPYLIAVSDNLTVEDSDVTNLNFYIVYQSEDISLEDYTNVNEVGIGTRNIEVYDDLSLTDYIEKYLSLYEINENDSIEMQDSTSSALDLYLISESDSLAISDNITSRLTPYLISEYEPVTVQEYSNLIVALKTRIAIGTDSIELSDYADVSFAVYPFLYAILRAKNTESVFEVNKTRTELKVTN